MSNSMRDQPDASQYLSDVFLGGLLESELFWRDNSEWLKKCGYGLRPRYRRGWTPSWIKSKQSPLNCEDGTSSLSHNVVDARRTSDGAIVVLKRVNARNPSNPELKMGPLFSTEPFASDPSNHCIPVHETLDLPNTDEEVLIVMPYLRDWDFPSFDTIGEVIEFCRQVFEGLQFMHEHHIAHNDIKFNNIMMDASPLYNYLIHPVHTYRSYDWKRWLNPKMRTRRPVKYYFIDFDLCEKYDPADGPALKAPGYGGDKTVPEYRYPEQLCDPFAVDVYHLGNVLRSRLVGGAPDGELARNPAFAFMQPLIDDMTQDDPEKRPKMDKVVSRFSDIVAGMNQRQLRSPIWQDNSFRSRLVKKPLHWCRHLYNMITRVPAIPTPK